MLSPKNNVFRMYRPKNDNGELVLVQEVNLTSEQKELYLSLFYDCVLNINNELNQKQHEVIMKTATSSMAYALYLMDPNHANLLIEEAYAAYKKLGETKLFDSLPDNISKLEKIITNNLTVIFDRIKKEGLDGVFLKTDETDVFNDLENIFMHISYGACSAMLTQYDTILDLE